MFQTKENHESITWIFEGDLSFKTVSALEKQSHAHHVNLAQYSNWIVDMTKVEKVDTAGLSYLLLQKTQAKKLNIDFKIMGYKKHIKMLELAKAQGVDTILFNA